MQLSGKGSRVVMRIPSGIGVLKLLVLCAAALSACGGLAPVSAYAAGTVTDSLYNAHHPRILFTPSEIPELRAKVNDGGYDDDAYSYLRFLAEEVYVHLSASGVLGGEYGLNALPNLGLAALLESPPDTAALEIGREATVYLADNYDVDNDEGGSGLRLRGLVLGYDMFFADAPESVRTYVRDEIVSYVQHMVNNFVYELFEHRPYLGNHSAMFGGPLGMAAICLEDEADAQLLAEAMAKADRIIDKLVSYQLDPGGAYKEGVLYGAWTTRQLIFYFHARKRYDGYNYADYEAFRNMEKWFAYEMMPEGWGKTNNLNDSPYNTTPLAWHTTYFDWAQGEWDSGLSAWIWEHAVGPYGVDLFMNAEKASTVLWNGVTAPVHPDSILPGRCLWTDRGLYYYRTGWPSGMSSGDVLFSFYSGKFHGGHAQEDQNQFTLYAYGEKFAIDHGPNKQSEVHNMVFIDGAGQHNAGGSIGTDGLMAEYVLSGFADYLLGDATAAYTTHSEFNDPDVPFPGADWSWGYVGANPVEHAYRRVTVVHHAETPPYFVIMDDIDKDGLQHDYEWRLHTRAGNVVNTGSNPIRISGAGGELDLHVLYPEFSSLGISTIFFNNGNADPDAILLRVSRVDINPRFSFLFFPYDSLVTKPQVARETAAWGFASTLDWGGGLNDILLGNHAGGRVSWGEDSITTDAAFALIRRQDSTVTGYLLAGATVFDYRGTDYARFFDGAVNCAFSGGILELDRGNAHFRVVDTGIGRIACRGDAVEFIRAGGYVLPADPPSSVVETRAATLRVSVSAYPNPFNPVTKISIRLESRAFVTAMVYDVLGRPITKLLRQALERGTHPLVWKGEGADGRPVPSGIYFLRVLADGQSVTKKLTVLK